MTFLNHGSFGACPLDVLDHQQAIRAEMEREPVDFLVRRMTPLLDESREALAGLIGADPAGLVFVQNATAGVNAVLRSLPFRSGDEILVTNHDYNACRNVVRYVAEQTGAALVEAELPLPIDSPQQVIDAVLSRTTSRTRLALLDHITSPTALVFPIEELVGELNRRGIDTLVDGAHAPGMAPLNMKRLGAAYYTGNCHKWLCAPKGAGFLYVRRDRQEGIQPPIISHGWNRRRPGYSPFQDAFDWPGTLDPSAWLCVGHAIRFMSTLMPGGLPALMERNHKLAMLGRRTLCQRLGLLPVGQEPMLGSMAAAILPNHIAARFLRRQPSGTLDNAALHDELFDRHHIEAPTYCWPAAPQLMLRISAQAYNDAGQYERLTGALTKIQNGE
ncbi:MAG: aminotransferase class V-fold PLP-dependent enzyme [Planctomycetaceae bacterium]|nr:aminotransferase class V-fold PLP-dependent enzyme [Planctomycetaceae bacterium]